MNLRFHISELPHYVWSDEAISNLVGQDTKVAGCPARIIQAKRCAREISGVDIVVTLDNAFESYLDFVQFFRRNALEGILLPIPEAKKDGKEKKFGIEGK